ncbi:hypothetical protein EFK50_13000 [Nocardioides marmoriginsengisoli]|uniref:Uncharacterized protein n=1 Tax=Nocardioides marmoriginsengisoli TaxID=661483 RepID=A0A3N0CHB2_9ACTN|nr:hypothetical protein [Nocardioides marmoriginsengisoli]RNL62669.1 hypothetical protein EFK50_13000 [Nocardioides marmoriginsengisoli]
MEILLWLLPAAVVTGIAMLWAGWAGREAPDRERSEAEQERFAAAIMRPLPTAAKARPQPRSRERSTGVAVRPSERESPRRSA